MCHAMLCDIVRRQSGAPFPFSLLRINRGRSKTWKPERVKQIKEMLRINLRKSLPQNTTLSKRLAWCRRERKVKFLVLAIKLYQPHDVSVSSLVYLRIAFSVRYFSGRTCYLFFFLSYSKQLLLLTYSFGLLICSVIWSSHTPVTWFKKNHHHPTD